MKKIIYLLVILPLLGMLGSCDSDDALVFDHELPQFEIKSNDILLEVIMPQGSTGTDTYYIVGDFNGGMEEAIDNLEWQLEKSSGNDMKWGIYLNPSSFKNGKTLADGFTFYSKKEGAERSVFNKEVMHTLTVAVGTRTNVWVDRWESYFGNVQKDFYTIFVDNQSGWEALALHYWGAIESEGVAGTEWPGLQPAGKTTINGVEYTYFELPKELKGKSINTIFNNNGGGSQFNAKFDFVVERDLYVKITNSDYEEVDPNDTYNGYTIFVEDQSGWDALAIYGWADGAPVTPEWPGLVATGAKTINGVQYTSFRVGEGLSGASMNLIFNNTVGGDGYQFDGPYITLNRDYYYQITSSAVKEVDPFATGESTYKVYVENNSGWNPLNLYYYGDGITDPGWPGLTPSGTKEIDGVTYTYFELPSSIIDKSVNLIFNNTVGGESGQFNGPYVAINRDYYYQITASSYNEINK